MKTLLVFILTMFSVRAFAGLPSQDDTPYPPRLPSPSSVLIRDSAVIDADAATIWNVMVDLPAYESWNPWVVSARGDVGQGGVIYVRVKLGPITMRAKHVVLVAEPSQRFCWRDAGWNVNFAYAQRCRTLTVQNDGRVLYEVEILMDSIFNGLSASLHKELRRGLHAETVALKRHSEELTAGKSR